MAIAYDNSTYSSSGSFSHTTTGSNMGMVIFERYIGSGNFSTISYNGTNLTRITQNIHVGTGTNFIASFYLNAPTTGSHTVSVSGAGGNSVGVAVLTYSGIKQSGQPASNSGGSGQSVGVSPSVNITTVTDGSWVIVGLASDNGSPNSETGWILRGTSGTTMPSGDTNSTVAAGAHSYSASFSSSSANTAMTAVELEDVTPPSTPSGFLMFM